MLTSKTGEAAAREIQDWANGIARQIDEAVSVEVLHDADSGGYLHRVSKGARVLLFRLSEAQIHTPAREAECERTLRRKIKDLWSLI
jgi:hypothetical protein